MGSQIIKISPDRDLYMEWSSVVEAPTWFGNRADTLAYLVDDYRPGTDRHADETERAERRLRRADETGSSGHKPWGCAWDDHGEIYQQQGYLPRARFGEFADRFLAAGEEVEDPGVTDLLEPFEDGPLDPEGAY